MGTKTKSTIVKEAELSNKPIDPRVFKDHRIDPMKIYGVADAVNGKTEQLRDHPNFSNPRSPANMDWGIVEDVAATGEIMEPVKLYWNSTGEVVLADGKTRMTGIILYLRSHPEMIGNLEIPLLRVKGTDNEIRLMMLAYGLKESRKPLNEADVSKFLRKLDIMGVSTDEQLRVLDKSGRKGILYLNELKRVFDANPAVIEAFEQGKIDKTTANMISKKEFSEQKQVLEDFLDLKLQHPDKTEAELRQMSGVKRPSRTTLGFSPTINYVVGQVYSKAKPYLQVDKEAQRRKEETLEKATKALKDAGVFNEFQEIQQAEAITTSWEHFMMFLGLEGKTRAEQLAFIESNADPEELAKVTEGDEITVSVEESTPPKKKPAVRVRKG